MALPTNEYLERFNGGQLEVQNQIEEYLYRGEIKTARMENSDLFVKLSWNAKGEGYPPIPNHWVNDTDASHLDYAASMDIYQVVEMSEKRLVLNSSIVNETTVLFSRDGSRLDPSKVEGLVLS